jgi:uncharacterized protein (UPF0332 family)
MPDRAFDWIEYLTLAQELGRRNEEACLRTSLSRAYYYVYHQALNRAEQNGFRSSEGESTHTQLWRLFHKSPDPACVVLGQIALRLKGRREKADYRSVYRRIAEDVQDALTDAVTFVNGLRELPPRLPNPMTVRH